MEVYFDNSATTRCYDSVKDIVVRRMSRGLWKSLSHAWEGSRGRKIYKGISCKAGGALKVQEKEILFTSGVRSLSNPAFGWRGYGK